MSVVRRKLLVTKVFTKLWTMANERNLALMEKTLAGNSEAAQASIAVGFDTAFPLEL